MGVVRSSQLDEMKIKKGYKMKYDYGHAPCCQGCCDTLRELCYVCGQCDQLDPFGGADDCEMEGFDPGESLSDPSETEWKD